MTYSRRHLYALGEPFGDACTRRTEAGRLICGGGGGSSSSSSSSTTNTTDKRMVVDNGIGISSDSSTVTVNALDADIVNKSLDTVAGANAIAGDGFSRLLTLADRLLTGGAQMVTQTQEATLAAYRNAATDQTGAIDQKTMIVIAVAGAAAAVAITRKR